MTDLYQIIIDGIKNQEGLTDLQMVDRLQGLQPAVKRLRRLYCNYPVHVPYNEVDIQAAYLLTYFPHYYQLIYKTFLEEYPLIFEKCQNVKLLYFGGGPGPEVYGTLKYIANNAKHVKSIEVIIFDINAKQWNYSHEILMNTILPSLGLNGISINFSANYFDLTKPFVNNLYIPFFLESNLLVFQNCLNEIPVEHLEQLENNILRMLDLLPSGGSVIMNDLAGGYQAVQSRMKRIESLAVEIHRVAVIHTSQIQESNKTLHSVHSYPPPIIRENLLLGSDGLIPRKYLKYNYSFFSKTKIAKEEFHTLGLKALYRPLDFKHLDAIDAINTKSFIGIDFGTSTTVVSLARVDNGEIITEPINVGQKDAGGNKDYLRKFESAIAYTGDYLLFGKHAYDLKNDLIQHHNLWHSFKMELGQEIEYKNSVLAKSTEFCIANTTDAIAMYFWYLKKEIEAYIAQKNYPDNIEYIVSIPASFKEQQRVQLLKCLKRANIFVNNHPFIDEPIAAFINYIYESRDEAISLDSSKNILVLDLGAGTCDISVLKIEINENGINANNLAIARHGNIGGEKLDSMISDDVLKEQFLNSIGTNSEEAYQIAFNQVRSIAEKIKIKLCNQVNVFPDNNFALSADAISEKQVGLLSQKTSLGTFINPNMSRKEFFQIMKKYMGFADHKEGTISYSLNNALIKANLEQNDINYILLTGGGSRNPYFRSLIAEEYKNTVLLIPDNIQEHVARGSAIHSLILNAYGSFIIPPTLSDDIYILHLNKKKRLFSSNTYLPSEEVVIENIVPDSNNQGLIDIPIIDGNDSEIISILQFKIKQGEIYKVIFWIDANKTIQCEVHSSQDIIASEFVNPNGYLYAKNQFKINH